MSSLMARISPTQSVIYHRRLAGHPISEAPPVTTVTCPSVSSHLEGILVPYFFCHYYTSPTHCWSKLPGQLSYFLSIQVCKSFQEKLCSESFSELSLVPRRFSFPSSLWMCKLEQEFKLPSLDSISLKMNGHRKCQRWPRWWNHLTCSSVGSWFPLGHKLLEDKFSLRQQLWCKPTKTE